MLPTTQAIICPVGGDDPDTYRPFAFIIIHRLKLSLAVLQASLQLLSVFVIRNLGFSSPHVVAEFFTWKQDAHFISACSKDDGRLDTFTECPH
jgi:hypothetical protein